MKRLCQDHTFDPKSPPRLPALGQRGRGHRNESRGRTLTTRRWDTEDGTQASSRVASV